MKKWMTKKEKERPEVTVDGKRVFRVTMKRSFTKSVEVCADDEVQAEDAAADMCDDIDWDSGSSDLELVNVEVQDCTGRFRPWTVQDK